MKKTISVIIILLIYILSISSIAYAASLQAKLEVTVDKTEITKGGEYVTFSIKIKDIANAADGSVTAAEGTIVYNKDFFEIINPDDCTGIMINQTNGMFSVAFSATSSKDLGLIKLKVKNSPTGIGNVKFTGLTASDGEEIAKTDDQEFTIKMKDNEIETKKLSSIEVTKEPNKINYMEGETFDKSGMVITAKYTDGSSKEVTNYTYEPNGALSKSNTKVTISYTESGITKTTEQNIVVNEKSMSDSDENKNNNNSNNNNNNINNSSNSTNQTGKEDPTTANKILAKTGVKDYIYIFIAAVSIIVIGIVHYIKYNKYKII